MLFVLYDILLELEMLAREKAIHVDGSPRSDEGHQEGVRRRLLYIHE